MRTQSVSHHNAWICFHSNALSPFISFVCFCTSWFSAFVITEFCLTDLGGCSLYFIKDTCNTLWMYFSKLNDNSTEFFLGLSLKKNVNGVNWRYTTPQDRKTMYLLSVYDQTSYCFSCNDVGSSDILPERKTQYIYKYISFLKHFKNKILGFTTFFIYWFGLLFVICTGLKCVRAKNRTQKENQK